MQPLSNTCDKHNISPGGVLRNIAIAALIPVLVLLTIDTRQGTLWAEQSYFDHPPATEDTKPTRIIIKLTGHNAESVSQKIAALTGVGVTVLRTMSGSSVVLEFNKRVETSRIRRLIERLMHQGVIEYGQLDGAVTVQTRPNDELYPDQWPLHDRSKSVAGINLEAAWEISRGSSETTIAIIDTGVRYEHTDLRNRLLAGYDFVSGVNEVPETLLPVDSDFNYARANDADGRDPDATDPGDGVEANFKNRASSAGLECVVMDSTWHGTAMASLVAANGDDGIGMAGVDWKASILPVRAVGRCGGSRSDLIDAIRWAAGVEDPALPLNPTPARIINLSLGIDDACGPADQQAIDDATAAGAIVVAAVGNQGRDLNSSPSAPSDCKNVIGVSAVNASGHLANYSNYGIDADIAAPGGESSTGDAREIPVAANEGQLSPLPGSAHRFTSGTSVASPLVAGVLSLMIGANPALTNEELEYLLYKTTATFTANGHDRDCNTFECGAGMLDAYAAVTAARGAVGVGVEVPQSFRQREGPITTGGGGAAGAGCSIVNVASLDPTFFVLLVCLAVARMLRRTGYRRV